MTAFPEGPGALRDARRAKTDGEGRFEMILGVVGTYSFKARARGGRITTFRVEVPPVEEYDLHLELPEGPDQLFAPGDLLGDLETGPDGRVGSYLFRVLRPTGWSKRKGLWRRPGAMPSSPLQLCWLWGRSRLSGIFTSVPRR